MIFLSQEVVLISANSADHDEMLPYDAGKKYIIVNTCTVCILKKAKCPLNT